MKRVSLIQLALLLGVLGCISAYLLYFKDQKLSPLEAERAFAVQNLEEIDKIILNNKLGDSIYLEKKNGFWMLNGNHKVFPNAIENLLQTITSVKMQSIPPKTYDQSILEGIRGSGIKVAIFNKRNEKIKSYWVGGTTQREDGNFFLMEGAQQAYIVSIPSFVGNIRERYDLSYVDWRDKTLIDIPESQITSIDIKYPYQNQNSFTIRKNENQYQLMDPEQLDNPLPVAKENLLKNYFASTQHIVVEGIQNIHPKKSEISAMIPFCEITIHAQTEPSVSVYKFYPIIEDSIEGTTVKVDPAYTNQRSFFRLHVVRSDGDFLLVQYPLVGPLLKTKYDFLGK